MNHPGEIEQKRQEMERREWERKKSIGGGSRGDWHREREEFYGFIKNEGEGV